MTPEIQNDQRGLSQSQSLFQLETELVELMSLREEMAEAGEDTAPIDNQLAEYVRREVKKVDNIRGYLRHCEMMSAALEDEVKRLQRLWGTWIARRDRLKECCKVTMEAVGAKRIEGQTGSISLKGNGGPAPLEIYDESLVPGEVCDWVGSVPGDRILAMRETLCDREWELVIAVLLPFLKRTPNNTRIREALQAGPVAGCRLGERGTTLVVK